MITKYCSKLNKYALLVQIESIFTVNYRRKTNFKVIPGNATKSAVSLSYKIYGEPTIYPEEPTILLVHGLLGSKKHWDSIGKTMVNVMKTAVVSIDLRNHGVSPHVNSHKYEDLVGDILKLLDKLSIKRASLVGHSMGGRAVMGVSLTAPDKVAGLLVIDISPISTARHLTDFLPEVLKAMKQIDFKKSTKLSAAKQEVKKQLKSIVKDDLLLRAILSNIKMKSDRKIGWVCNIDILVKHFKYIASFPEILRKKTFYGPTLFIGGQLSEYLPIGLFIFKTNLPPVSNVYGCVEERANKLHNTHLLKVLQRYLISKTYWVHDYNNPDDLSGIREMFPRAVVSYIPEVGHNLHVEDPQIFLEIAIPFLRTNK